jgi:hypothetical protein
MVAQVIADWSKLEATVEGLSEDDRLRLIEILSRSLRASSPTAVSRQAAARQSLMNELAALPVNNPADGFSNRQHDTLLYGVRQ